MINIEALYGPKFMKLLQICRQKFCEFHLRYFIDQQRLLLIDAKSIFSLHFDRSFLKCSCCCTVHTLNLPATTLFLLSLRHFFVPSWHGHFFILKKVKKTADCCWYSFENFVTLLVAQLGTQHNAQLAQNRQVIICIGSKLRRINVKQQIRWFSFEMFLRQVR